MSLNPSANQVNRRVTAQALTPPPRSRRSQPFLTRRHVACPGSQENGSIPAINDRLTCPGARDNLGCKIIRSRWLMRKQPAGKVILCREKIGRYLCFSMGPKFLAPHMLTRCGMGALVQSYAGGAKRTVPLSRMAAGLDPPTYMI
jgi:hypothetical protein